MAHPDRAVILTALRVEYQAVQAHLLDLQEEVHPQGTVYERGRFVAGSRTWDVLLGEIGPGNDGAAQECERAIAHFLPDRLSSAVRLPALADLIRQRTPANPPSTRRCPRPPQYNSRVVLSRYVERRDTWQSDEL